MQSYSKQQYIGRNVWRISGKVSLLTFEAIVLIKPSVALSTIEAYDYTMCTSILIIIV